MNANEVIADRAPRQLGLEKGRYDVPAPGQPGRRVAEHQRRLPDRAARHGLVGIDALSTVMAELARAFEAKAPEFKMCSRSAAPSCRTRCR